MQMDRTSLEWCIAGDRDAMHASALAVVVVERAMLGAAVVPDRHRADLPAESAGQFRLHRMRHQEFDDRPRLGVPETVQRLRVVADIERLAAGFGVGES